MPTPDESARTALELWISVARLRSALERGQIDPSVLSGKLTIEADGRSAEVGAAPPTVDHWLGVTLVMLLQTLGTLSIQTDRALDAKFGAKGTAPRDTETVRDVVYMVRCAFAHDPADPVWKAKPKYRRVMSVAALKLTLDMAALDGTKFELTQFPGGILGALDLMRHAQDLLTPLSA